MADRNTILRHIETSVDVDEWAVIGVKENFEKLENIEQIVKEYDGSTLSMIKQFSEIQKVLEQE